MKQLLRIFNAIILLVSSPLAYAVNFTVGDLYYSTTGSNASVSSNSKYITNVIIPETILYNGVNYSVTSIQNNAFSGCSYLAEITIPNSVTSIGSSAFYNCSSLAEITIPNSVTSIGNEAFKDCSSLKEVTLEDGEKTLSLGYNYSAFGDVGQFRDCPLEKVYIGRNLSYSSGFDSSPFAKQTKLTSVIIGSNVTSIGRFLFYGCSSLTEITIPNSVKTIGEWAFDGCSALAEITIPNSVTSIGNHTFATCSSLAEITIPNSVTSIGSSAFANCSSLAEITIPNSVKTIGEIAFDGCSSLAEISIPSSVISIGNRAFSGCENLKSIYYDPGDEQTNIGSDSFDFGLPCLYISTPDKTLAILDNPIWNQFSKILYKENDKIYAPVRGDFVLNLSDFFFSNEEGYLSEVNNTIILKANEDVLMAIYGGTDILNELQSEDGFYFTPSVLWRLNYIYGAEFDSNETRSVKVEIAGNLFNELGIQNIEKIHYLKISGNLNGTDIMTINRMTSLEYLDISEANIVEGGQTYRENLKTRNNIIGSYFFSDCQNLTNLILPNTVTTIQSYAFSGQSNIINILMGSNTETIQSSAFWNCSSLISISIPNLVTSLTDSQFSRCSGLREVRIEDGESTLSLGYNSSHSDAFRDCPLEKVYIGRNLNYSISYSYNYSPFEKQTKLTSVTIGPKVTFIDGYLCYECTALSNLIISNSVTYIGSYAFYDCSSLSDITIPNSVTSIGQYSFYGCSSAVELNLSESLTQIPQHAFYGCSSLIAVNVPERVTSIRNNAFYGCSSMKELTLGAKLPSIEDYGFANCSNLAKIRSLNPTPPEITTSVFSGVDKETCQLIVTKGNLVYYWLDPVWKEFLNISDDMVYLSPLPSVTYGAEPVDLSLYAPEGFTFTYETSNPDVALIDGTMLSIVGAGTATVGALYDQSGTPMEIIGQMRQFIVDKAELTIEVENMSIEQGDPIPPFVLKTEGLVYDETLEDVGELPEIICEATETSAPGEYPIYLVGGESRNYNFNLVAGVLTILERETTDVKDIPTVEGNASDSIVHVFDYNGVLIYEGPEDEMELEKGLYVVVKRKESKKILIK